MASFKTFDVGMREGVHGVLSNDLRFSPIRMIGRPVTSFLSGWSPTVLVDLGAGVTLLELSHEAGMRATWFLDSDHNRICDALLQLDDARKASLLSAIAPYLQAVQDDLVSAVRPLVPAGAAIFGRINPATALGLVQLWRHATIGDPAVIDVEREQPSGFVLEAVRHGFGLDLQAAFDAAIREGALCWPSPFNGETLRSRDSLVIHEHRMAYRFVDESAGQLFFVGATHRVFKAADLFVPSQATVLIDGPDDGRAPARAVFDEYLVHFATHASGIAAYLDRDARECAVVLRGFPSMHIGHHVWNELTALDRLQRGLQRHELPSVIVPDAEAGSEPFGPIDRIFEEFAGCIDRGFSIRRESLGDYAYRNSCLLFRTIDERVTSGLGRRVQACCAAEASATGAVSHAEKLRAEGATIVLFGLRVENRTAANLFDAIEAIINRLAATTERLAVVIDGHNARLGNDPTSCFSSFGQPAELHPLLPELELVMRLRRRYPGGKVTIVNTVGSSVATSVAWGVACDFFVAIWGASLAKYRWVCNKPGLVISSAYNLTQRQDLHIYDRLEDGDASAPIAYLDPAYVTDRPDLPVSFSPVHPVHASYANFVLNVELVADAVADFRKNMSS